MPDITPAIPPGRQIIQGYGSGGFRIAGTRYEGSVLVFRETTLPWSAAAPSDLTPAALAPVFASCGEIDILLIGCGERFAPLAGALREALRTGGIAAEPMGTGAACRTFNVLLAEDRRVAAALIAVP